MSLEALLNLRRKRLTPVVVWVVVGDCPKRLIGSPDCIAVPASPEAMDWRPVVGLHVDVFDLSGDPILLDRTLGAIEAAGPKGVGVACDEGVVGLTDEHEFTLRSIRRHLARSH